MEYKTIQSYKEIPELEQLMFEFYESTLKGTSTTTFNDRIISILNKIAPEQLGQLYAEYTNINQHQLDEMVQHIVNETIIFIDNSKLTAETKLQAQKKIRNLKIKVGAPNIAIEIADFNSITDIHKKRYQLLLEKFDKPADPNDWSLSPHIVNARSIWSQNEIIFPAALMQYPMFVNNSNNSSVLLATNYGAMGTIIAHEITHALDDRGRNYDSDCKVRNFMTKSDIEVFNNGMNIIREQIKDYNTKNTKYQINPDLVMTEVMADIGGMQISFSAMKRLLQSNEFNKVFFESFARALRLKMRPQVFEMSLKANPHAPVEYRVDLLRNIPEFCEAYPQFPKLKNPMIIWN